MGPDERRNSPRKVSSKRLQICRNSQIRAPKYFSGMPRTILIQDPDGQTKTMPLSGTRLAVARSSSVELSFPDDAGLSRQHFALELTGDDWTVQDLGGKNGGLRQRHPTQGAPLAAAGRPDAFAVNESTPTGAGDRVGSGASPAIPGIHPASAADAYGAVSGEAPPNPFGAAFT